MGGPLAGGPLPVPTCGDREGGGLLCAHTSPFSLSALSSGCIHVRGPIVLRDQRCTVPPTVDVVQTGSDGTRKLLASRSIGACGSGSGLGWGGGGGTATPMGGPDEPVGVLPASEVNLRCRPGGGIFNRCFQSAERGNGVVVPPDGCAPVGGSLGAQREVDLHGKPAGGRDVRRGGRARGDMRGHARGR